MNRVLLDGAIATVLGIGLGLGLSSLLATTPRFGAVSLAMRVAPYVRGMDLAAGWAVPVSRRWDVRSLGTLIGGRTRTLVGRIVGGSEALAARLTQAGWTTDPTGFRAAQLGWGIVGALSGAAFAVVLAVLGRAGPPSLALPLVGGTIGIVACEVRLHLAASRRRARLEAELPSILEFLALCLSAGEGLMDSVRRVADVGSGELSRKLRRVVLEVGTGASLADALASMARGAAVPALSRAVDHLIAAIERGAPLASVLEAQATDARVTAKQALIEGAGRKEIYMLLPLVFFILPLSVLFAVYPGVFMLRTGLG